MKINRRFAISTLLFFASSLAVHAGFSSYADGPDSDVTSVALQTSGSAIISGRFLNDHIAKLRPDGTPDPSFSSTWMTAGFNRDVSAMAVQADGALVVTGKFTNFDASITGSIARIRPDGTLDLDFANGVGTGFDDETTDVAIQPDGKILVAGSFRSFNGSEIHRIARLEPDGKLDPSFSVKIPIDGQIASLAVTPQGLILIGTNSSPFFLALSPDGSLISE